MQRTEALNTVEFRKEAMLGGQHNCLEGGGVGDGRNALDTGFAVYVGISLELIPPGKKSPHQPWRLISPGAFNHHLSLCQVCCL